MVTAAAARRLALELPGVTELEHHGLPSFRVGGRIFATLPEPGRLRAMLDEHGIRSAVANNPDSCRGFYWGKRLACVEIDLARASTALVRTLLSEAWQEKSAHAR